jgi:hypothetical protein
MVWLSSGGNVRAGSIIIIIWLVIGVFAAYQRGYLSRDPQVSCAQAGTVLATIVAGPLNYVGLNPRIQCRVPTPSQ